jgi:uncharacterized repeat protein (TIGR03833 family)
MNGQNRKDIYPGLEVDIILKKDQRSGVLTKGVVQAILTSAAFHSRGISTGSSPVRQRIIKPVSPDLIRPGVTREKGTIES